MLLKFWLYLRVLLFRVKSRLLPPPPKEFYAQCERCYSSSPSTAQVILKAASIKDAMTQIPTEFLCDHPNHRIGVFSADGKQDESFDWSKGA